MTYAPGGLTGGTALMPLDDDECVLGSDLSACVRMDERHHHEMFEVRTLAGAVREYAGPCIHRHVVPVESVVDGSTLAHLCRNCDDQLIA